MILCCGKVNCCSFGNLFKSLMVLTKVWALFEVVDEGTFHLDNATIHTDLQRRSSDIISTIGTSYSNIRVLMLVRTCVDHYFIIVILFQSCILLLVGHFLFHISKVVFSFLWNASRLTKLLPSFSFLQSKF